MQAGPTHVPSVFSSIVVIVTDTLHLCSVLPKIQVSAVVTNTCAEYWIQRWIPSHPSLFQQWTSHCVANRLFINNWGSCLEGLIFTL